MKILFYIIYLSSYLFSNSTLEHEYFIQQNNIMLSDIIKNPKQDIKLYSLEQNKHTKRVKSKELIKKLNYFGYKDFKYKYPITQFTKKSPIDIDNFKKDIFLLYKKAYSKINIKAININPRSYIETLPTKYTTIFPKNATLKKENIFYIKSSNKKIFFNYDIDAMVDIYISTQDIKKGTKLTNFNIKRKTIHLDKFRAKPITNFKEKLYQAKYKIKKNSIITYRNIEELYFVKRGSDVNAILKNNGITISFDAKALQNGKLHDTIYIQNSNKKKIKALIIGQNKVEIK